MTSEDDDLELAKTRLGLTLRGKYRLDRVLGVGGMAAVYVATHRNQKQFAVKVLHPEISRSADVRTRFVREGYAANSVNHRGAVAVLDDDTAEDGSAFLVMELLEGEPVESLWDKRGRRLAIGEVLAIAAQLLDVLAAAHAKGIVHRDIKPANIFLTREGQIKVLDFGIARVRDAASNASHMTATGALLGTPAFMPPEQALGNVNDLDGQTDLWAVGATMFALTTGQYVHDADTVQKLMILAATTPPRSLLSVAPDAHVSFAAIVDRALSFQKAGRFANALEMKAAVEEVYGAIFQRPLGPDALAALAGRDPRRTDSFVAGATQLASTPPPPPQYLPASTPPPPLAPMAGTVAAMSSTRLDRGAPPKSSAGIVITLAGAALALLLLAGGVYMMRSARRSSVSALPQSDVAGMGAPADITASPPLRPLPAFPPLSLPAPGVLATDPRPSIPPLESSSVAIAPPAPPPTYAGTKPSGGAKPASSTRARPSTKQQKDCDPNYTLDAEGNKHFKPECFE